MKYKGLALYALDLLKQFSALIQILNTLLN